jgi:hypothetical protein
VLKPIGGSLSVVWDRARAQGASDQLKKIDGIRQIDEFHVSTWLEVLDARL